jgi:hypothetical protein
MEVQLKTLEKGVIKMVCQSIKEGVECIFMTKKGCGFNGGRCHPITDKCDGCDKIIECPTGKYCMVYPDPASKWAMGGCVMASHTLMGTKEVAQKINPLKSSKRSHR